MRVWLRTARWFVLSSVPPRERGRFRRLARRWPSALCPAFAMLFLSYLMCWSPRAFANWKSRADIRRQAYAAASEGLSYEAVRRAPMAHAGSTVRWHVLRRGERWFYQGDANRPIAWLGRGPDIHTGERHSIVVVASVAGTEAEGVCLAFEGADDGFSPMMLLRF